MIKTWDDLTFWSSKEWQKLQEKFDANLIWPYNPKREDLFASLDACPFNKTKVAFFGQDPYPGRNFATGVAFSIPSSISRETGWPPTLVNIFKEYCEDLHYEFPSSGDLSSWCKEGVLLQNIVPTCRSGSPSSHRSWNEWPCLAKEIVEELSAKGIIFVFLGGLARDYSKYVNPTNNIILSYSHPSPLGVNKTTSPFHGSRLFSTINAYLCKRKQGAIDWRLE